MLRLFFYTKYVGKKSKKSLIFDYPMKYRYLRHIILCILVTTGMIY